jgi:hypothetical protein
MDKNYLKIWNPLNIKEVDPAATKDDMRFF